MSLQSLEAKLQSLASPEIAEKGKRFHKAGEKETRTLGIRMPPLRELAKKNKTLPLKEVPEYLASPFHESRLLALLILVQKFTSADDAEKNQGLQRLPHPHRLFN